MAFTAGDVYRCVFRYRMRGQQCYNVTHQRVLTSGSGTIAENARWNELNNKMGNFFNNFMKTYTADEIEYLGYSATAIFALVLKAREWSAPGPGLRTGDLLPGFVSLPYYLGTEGVGRTKRGRFHLSGLLEDDQDGGELTSGGVAIAEAFRAGLATYMGSSSYWEGGVWSRKIAEQGLPPSVAYPEGVPPSPTLAFTPVTSVVRGGVLGSMYSRKIGSGA